MYIRTTLLNQNCISDHFLKPCDFMISGNDVTSCDYRSLCEEDGCSISLVDDKVKFTQQPADGCWRKVILKFCCQNIFKKSTHGPYMIIPWICAYYCLRNHHRLSGLGCLRPRTVLSLEEDWVESPILWQGSDCLRFETTHTNYWVMVPIRMQQIMENLHDATLFW